MVEVDIHAEAFSVGRSRDLDLIIIDHDPARRAVVARLAEDVEISRVVLVEAWPESLTESFVTKPTVVLVDGALLRYQALDLSRLVRSGLVFVAVVHGESATTFEFLAVGCVRVLCSPITVTDLERIAAIARSVLAQESDRQRRQLVKLHALRQVGADLTLLAELTPEWLMQGLRVLQQLLGVPALAVWRIDWENNAVVKEGAVGLTAAFVREVEEKARGRAAELVHRVLESSVRPIAMLERADDDRGVTVSESCCEIGSEAEVVVPIRRAGRVVGMLSIYLRRVEDCDRAEMQLYDSAAEALAMAWTVAEARRELLLNQQLYRALVEEQPVGIVLCAIDGQVRLANGSAARLLGYECPERLLGVRLPEAVRTLAPLPWDEWCQRSAGVAASGVMIPVLSLDKRLRILEFHTRIVELPGAGARWEPQLQLVLRDVTLERRRLMELELLHDLTRMVSEDRDLDPAFQIVAERLQREFGYGLVGLALLSGDGSRFAGRAVRVEGGLTYNEWRADRGITGRAVRENRAQLVVDVRQDPDYFDAQPDLQMESEVVAVLRRNGQPIGVLNIESKQGHRLDQEDLRLAQNVAVHLELLMRQVELTEQLERQALSDPLTGLPNRRALLDHVRRMLSDRRVDNVIVVLIDFDGFKTLNDKQGHLFGDAMLQAVGQRLVQSLRPSDLIARYGGDEFAVVLTGANLHAAGEIAEWLRERIAGTPFQIHDQLVHLTISLGISAYPEHGETVDALLHAADHAMYAAKRRGGNAVALAEERTPR